MVTVNSIDEFFLSFDFFIKRLLLMFELDKTVHQCVRSNTLLNGSGDIHD
nr:MAG: hypothetical protein [Bacteriophage sp.]